MPVEILPSNFYQPYYFHPQVNSETH